MVLAKYVMVVLKTFDRPVMLGKLMSPPYNPGSKVRILISDKFNKFS